MASVALMNRGEFIDALAALRRGSVIVVLDQEARSCVLDGARLLWSFRSLDAYGLIAEFQNPNGFAGLRYFRITEIGTQFADSALAVWRTRPWLERLLIRLLG